MQNTAIGTVSPCQVEWEVPRFQETLIHGSVMYSHDFKQQGSIWCLTARYIAASDSRYHKFILIHLQRRDAGLPKTITFTIKFHGLTYVNKNTLTCYFPSNGSSVLGLQIPQDNWLSNLNLLVTCYIESQAPNPLARLKFESCAVQTEVFENENLESKDWPSTDIKGVTLLSERMKDLLMKGTDHDVTIYVQDKEFRAHRNILSIRSPVFAMMFSHDTKESITSTINIEDCDPESFDVFLTHVYTGRAENVTSNNALQLYYTADKYDFPGLKEVCLNLLKTSMSVESICSVVLLAAKHHEKELLDVATEFFVRNVKKILVTVGWQNFMTQNPVEANELYIKSMEILRPEQ